MSEQNHLDHHLSQKWVIKNTFWIYLVTFLIAPMQYIIRILVAEHLPLEQVGMFYSLLWLTGILAIYNDLWFREAIGYFYPKYLESKEYNKWKTLLIFSLLLQIISSFLFAVALFFAADRIAIHYLKDSSGAFAVQVFWVYLFVYIIYNFIDGVFLIFQDGFRNKMLGLLTQLLLTLCIFLTPLWLFQYIGVKSNLTGYILSWIVPGVIFIVIWWLIFIKKYYTLINKWSYKRDRWEYKKVQSYAFGVLITNNILFLISQIDLQFTTFLFGTKEAWLYSYGMMVTNLIITLLSPIVGLLYPMISHLKARKENEKLKLIMYGVLNYLGIIALVGSLFLFVYSSYITSFLFWPEYRHAWSIIKWNLLFVVFGLLWWVLYSVYAGLGMVKGRMKMLVWVLVFNLLCNVILSKFFGVNGIALTIGLTWLLMFSYGYRDLKKHEVPIDIDRKFFVWNIILGAALLFWLSYMYPIDLSDRWSVWIHLLYCWIIYTAWITVWNAARLKKIWEFGNQMIKW